jgi:hypothetical protein
MVDPIFRKTEAGQEEIRTRERKLDQKLRALLLIVNGERAKSELVAQVGALGVAGEALDTLLALGLIEPIPAPTGAKPALSTAQATVRPTTGPARSAPQRAPAETNLFAAYSSFNTSDGKGIDDVLADTTIAPGPARREAIDAASHAGTRWLPAALSLLYGCDRQSPRPARLYAASQSGEGGDAGGAGCPA